MTSTVANIGEMVAFVRAATRQSFSVAARELHMTPSAVSKQVSRLENRLGVRLFNRTTRRLHLTRKEKPFCIGHGAYWPTSKMPNPKS